MPDEVLHIFIDANVLLAFFEYSDDDLNAIRSVIAGFKEKKLRPYINSQLVAEVQRNREAKTASALKKLNDQKLDLRFPTLCKGFDEYEALRDLQRAYSQKHGALLKQLTDTIEARQLLADAVLHDYFTSGEIGRISDELHELARKRIERGDPPPKSNSIGDAIQWEWLLGAVPDGADLHIVTMDRGFASEMDPRRIHEFLRLEWQSKKRATAHLYRNLTEFFTANLPHVKLPSDFRKSRLIAKLLESSNYHSTHQAIKALRSVDISSPLEAEEILRGALENNQVKWIMGDSDVSEYCRELVAKFEKDLDPDLVREVMEMTVPYEQREDTYDPFADNN